MNKMRRRLNLILVITVIFLLKSAIGYAQMPNGQFQTKMSEFIEKIKESYQRLAAYVKELKTAIFEYDELQDQMSEKAEQNKKKMKEQRERFEQNFDEMKHRQRDARDKAREMQRYQSQQLRSMQNLPGR